jgi:hypothetical protein
MRFPWFSAANGPKLDLSFAMNPFSLGALDTDWNRAHRENGFASKNEAALDLRPGDLAFAKIRVMIALILKAHHQVLPWQIARANENGRGGGDRNYVSTWNTGTYGKH